MKDVVILNNISKNYKENEIVNNINICLKKGSIYGLLGRNGAGKTTIMKMILGLTKANSGTISVLGKDPIVEKSVLKKVGCMIETPGFYPNLTGTENLEIFARLRNLPISRVKEVLEFVNLSYNDKKLFSKYSLGMKQRLAIANAIIHKPEVLILDEPSNGLDPIGISELRNFLKNLANSGVSIMVSSHILSEIEVLSDYIGILHNKTIIENIDLSNWNNKTSSSLKLNINDNLKCMNILTEKLNLQKDNFELIDNNILILSNLCIEENDIIKVLISNNIKINEIEKIQLNLEEYFKKITGGVGIE
nr:ATP-binding cassette domain-containing protein [uncultured Tyzzerella sp.]